MFLFFETIFLLEFSDLLCCIFIFVAWFLIDKKMR